MPKQVPESVAGLLDPHREIVDFAGRSRELAELLGWCADGQDAPLRIVVGLSGAGKTRLAIELARQMRLRGWRTEWASGGAAGQPAAQMSHRKTLLIVDQADERQDLDELLSRLTSEQPHARFLLLARGAGSWCDQLELYGQVNAALVSAARSALIELTPAGSDDLADQQAATDAARCFAAELGLPQPKRVDLAAIGATPSRMLDLHLTALTSLLGGKTRSALDKLVEHEEKSWSSEPGDLTTREQMAAGYLLGSRSCNAGLPIRVADQLAAGELIASPDFAKRCLAGIEADQAAQAVSVLARVSAGSHQPQEPLQTAIELLAGELEELDSAIPTQVAVLNALPYPSKPWSRAGAALCRRLVARIGEDADPAIRAYWLTSLGAREWHAGHRTEAISRTEQAVALRRDLVAVDTDRHLASLALSLGNLGHQLSGLDRTAEAISALEEAAAMYRAVAVVSPGRYLPGLVTTLSRLGRCYALAGRADEARQASEEAALIGDKLGFSRP